MNKIVLVCSLLVFGCSSSVKKKDIVVEEKKIEIPNAEISDKGPLFELADPPEFVKSIEKQKTKKVKVYKTKTHTYLKIEAISSLGSTKSARIRIPEIEAHLTGNFLGDALLIRIVGTPPIPEAFTVFYEVPSYRLDIEVSAKIKKSKKSLEGLYFSAMWPDSIGRASAYDQFLADRFLKLSRGKRNKAMRLDGAGSTTELQRIMNLYSGATSIRETLQNDRHLRGLKKEKQTIDVSTLALPGLAEHPWEEMIRTLGKASVIEPLAPYVSAHMGYAHFHDLPTFVKVANELEVLSPVIQSLEGEGGSREFVDYYTKQLILERKGMAEILGEQAVDSVAIVVGDSFVREGTDVGVLFRIENRLLLETALNTFESSARAKHPKINQYLIKIEDIDVRRIYTDDLQVNQFKAVYGDVLLIANSLKLVTDLVNTYKKKTPSLEDQGDFLYMRTKYPFSKENEAGFIFLSDAFVAKVVSPQTRIAAARRFQRESDILAVNYGAMLYAKLEGKLPKDLDTLASSGLMSKSEFFHASGAPILYTPKKGAYSTYGNARMMRPLSDIPVKMITKSEFEAYRRFQETYQSYWQKFIDPIAIQIQYDEDQKMMSAEVRILPIIDSSEYDRLIELVGESAAPRYTRVSEGIDWTFAIGKDAKIRDNLNASTKSMAGISVSWLGDWMQIGVADHSRMWDLLIAVADIPLESVETGESVNLSSRSILRVLQDLPTHVAFEISNELVFAAMLANLKSKADQAAPELIKWFPIAESYKEQNIVEVSGKDNYIGEFRIFYAIVNGTFIISPRLDYLHSQIDKFLSDPEMNAAGQSNIDLAMKRVGWLSKAAEVGLHSKTLLETHNRALELMEETIFSGKYDPLQTLNFQGFMPRSPFLGEVNIRDGVAVHSRFGRKFQFDVSKMESLVSKQIQKTKRIDASIAFDGKDNHRSLLVHLEWQKH